MFYSRFRSLYLYVIILFICGCAGGMLQKNIEEGRLTPEKAFDLNDNVLNDYTFGSADSNGLRFDVLSSRQRVWVDGDTLQVQVIVGAAESNKKRQNHFVFYSEG